jgi:hypothetical protein
MALPLLWLGAAALSALAINELDGDRKQQQLKRFNSPYPQTLSDLTEHESPVMIYPSDVFDTVQQVKPQVGAIVCCGIAGVLDHTGIWLGDDTIVELDGNGLIKPISSKRFIEERSGKQIFIACDSLAQPLISEPVAARAARQLFQSVDYHMVDNNCHQFVWQCFTKSAQSVTTFRKLNQQIAGYFNRVIYWDVVDLQACQYWH